jgi:hypothetical protein
MLKQMLKTGNQKQMIKMQIMDNVEHAEHKWIFWKLINMKKNISRTFVQLMENKDVFDRM